MSPMIDLSRAVLFAAKAHANQRRKGAAQEPYINHLLEVMEMVATATGGSDVELLIGAVLHDTIEDTALTSGDLEAAFGRRVAELVRANSDDMTLPKEERKRVRLQHAAAKATDAKIIKIADVISNVRAMVHSPPAGWPLEWKLSYLDGTRALCEAMRGVNAELDALAVEEIETAIEAVQTATAAALSQGEAGPRFTVDFNAGQPVHLLYVANTELKPFGEAERELLGQLIAQRFPSATIQAADGLVDGNLRPMAIVRLRADSTDGVIALAQHLCLAFRQRYVGLELEGRYLRIYADDTD